MRCPVKDTPEWSVKFIWWPVKLENIWIWWEYVLVKEVNYGVGVIRYIKNLDGSKIE